MDDWDHWAHADDGPQVFGRTIDELDEPRHSHVTRDIKAPGHCPACDQHHERARRRLAGLEIPLADPPPEALSHPRCAWCAGTFGQVTKEMRLGQPSPPQYLCPPHQARWDGLVKASEPLLRRELFHIPGNQGVMAGIPKRFSVSASAAAALGLADDPMLKVARDAVQDDLDRQRWEILRDAAYAVLPRICGAGQVHVPPVGVYGDPPGGDNVYDLPSEAITYTDAEDS